MSKITNGFTIQQVLAAIATVLGIAIAKSSLIVALGWTAYCIGVLLIPPTAIIWKSFILYLSLQFGGVIVAFVGSKLMGTPPKRIFEADPSKNSPSYTAKSAELAERATKLNQEIKDHLNSSPDKGSSDGGRMH